MTSPVLGLHHVTAICGDAQRNVDFYAGVLGLHMVKRTVNHDDPGTYHLYYGDARGTPGTLVTFFPWPGAAAGRHGNGQVQVISFAIPASSLGYWIERLVRHHVEHGPPGGRAGAKVISCKDPDGLMLELVTVSLESSAAPPETPVVRDAVPPEHAIRGVHSVTLWENELDRTAEVLTSLLGFVARGESTTSTFRFEREEGGVGSLVDVRAAPGFWEGASGVGTIHHVAFRVADDAALLALRERVVSAGLTATPVIDRTYFHSVYFREPGGVLFEIATDSPGFAVDEPADRLGERLVLPPRYEPMREEIERALPLVRPPTRHQNPGSPISAS